MKNQQTTLTCICCPIGCDLVLDKIDTGYSVTGHKCARGKKYAIEEMTAPKRIVTSTVKINGSLYPMLPVKTSGPVAKEKIFTVMEILSSVQLNSPVKIGDIVVKNVAESGVDVVATKDG